MPNETWTIKRCLDWTRDYLRDKGDERPRLAAEWLLSGVTGLSRTEIYMSFDKPMSVEELAAMHGASCAAQRESRCNTSLGKPILGPSPLRVSPASSFRAPRPSCWLRKCCGISIWRFWGPVSRNVASGLSCHGTRRSRPPWRRNGRLPRLRRREAPAERELTEHDLEVLSEELGEPAAVEGGADEGADVSDGDAPKAYRRLKADLTAWRSRISRTFFRAKRPPLLVCSRSGAVRGASRFPSLPNGVTACGAWRSTSSRAPWT